MKFAHVILRTVSVIALLTMAANAAAADTAPDAVKIGGIFTVPLDSSKSCNSAKPLDQINLQINGINSGIHPVGCNPANNKLTFELDRNQTAQDTTASRAAWESMLGNLSSDYPDFMRTLGYTVTQPSGTGMETLASGTLKLHQLNAGKAFLGAIMTAIIWALLLYLAKNSGLVRDAGNPGTTLNQRTYSLGRVQMAWWFAIILAAYIYLWVVTDGMPILSAQALGLMGISGAAGVVSLGVDSGKQTVFPVSSGNIFIDLLTDANGITIHRFQMLVMTVILGIFFVIHVIAHLSMPEFDSSTLTMLGISGLTYVGFKVPEQHTSPAGNVQPAAAVPGQLPPAEAPAK